MSTDKVPNLYDFLRGIVAAGPGEPISDVDIEWCRHYLERPDFELHLKGHFTGKFRLIEEELDPELAERYRLRGHHMEGKPAEPEISYDLGVAGRPEDVFVLLTEAMERNPNLASLMFSAVRFYREHVPECPHCREHHDPNAEHVNPMEITTWEFKPVKP